MGSDTLGDDEQIRARFGRSSVGTLVYVMQAHGIKRCFMTGVAPVTAANVLVGRARTLRTIPVREDLQEARRAQPRSADPHRIAMDQIGPGEVLVIDARRRLDAANLGDVLAQRMLTAGAAGVVTDGAVRDIIALDEVGLPVFAGAISAPTMGTQHLGIEVGGVIACGEVAVEPGDWIVGDREGVVVVPAAVADEISRAAIEQDGLDGFLREKIAGGATLADAYPPNAELRAEYDARRGAEAAGS